MDNRQRLMEQAERLFATRGYDAVGVADIVASAGLSKPSLYHHFGSKLGLLQAVLEEGCLALLARVGPAADYRRDLPLTLFRLVTAYCDFARERPDFYRLLLGLWLAPSQSESMAALRPWAQRQQELCAAIFLKATADHGNMRGRHRLYALTFLGMINTLLGASLNGYLTLNQELIFKAVHQFMHGIYS